MSTLLFGWSLFNIIPYGLSGDQRTAPYILIGCILGFIAIISAGTGSFDRFLFSCAFWVAVEFVFYIVIKSFYLIEEGDNVALNQALLISVIFLFGYAMGQPRGSPNPAVMPPRQETLLSENAKRRLYWGLVASFIFFKTLGAGLFYTLGQGQNVLEIAQSTQNQGAAYIFKIPALAQAAYFIFLLLAYKYKIFQRTTITLTLVVVAEAVIGAGRYTLITTAFINLFLYHTYVRPIKFRILIVASPPLIFIVAFFGYVRNIELANLQVYADALEMFIDKNELILELFLSRLDMLPNMIKALQLDEDGQLKNLSGASYFYAFLHAIPRNFWPNKPPLTAAQVTEQTNPFSFEDGVNIFPSIMLEGYMNLSWIGPLFIGIITARMAATYDRIIRGGSIAKQAFALMIFTFPMGLINEGIHSNIFASTIYLLVIYLCWIFCLKKAIGRNASKLLSTSSTKIQLYKT